MLGSRCFYVIFCRDGRFSGGRTIFALGDFWWGVIRARATKYVGMLEKRTSVGGRILHYGLASATFHASDRSDLRFMKHRSCRQIDP